MDLRPFYIILLDVWVGCADGSAGIAFPRIQSGSS